MKSITIILLHAADADTLKREEIQTAINKQLPAEKRYFTDMEKDWLLGEIHFKLMQSRDAALKVIREHLQECLEKQEYTKASFLRDVRKQMFEQEPETAVAS